MANGITRASGTPSYASDSASSFIPQLWAAKLVEKFYRTTVFGDIANTDYEGTISNMGDKVTIRTRPDITIKNYQIGQDLDYENPTSTAVNLNIDQGKYFGFKINDVDAYQSDISLMNEFTDDATEQMKISIDTDVLGSIYADVHGENAGNTAGAKSGSIALGSADTPLAVTKTNVLDWIVDMGTVLDEQEVPETGRWLLLPPWVVGMIKKSDLKDASLAGDSTSIMRNGKVGMIDRFTIYNTNGLHVDTGKTDVIAGHKSGLTFASQMTQMETLKNPKDFGDIVRGLNVFGYKVIGPKYLAHSVITRA